MKIEELRPEEVFEMIKHAEFTTSGDSVDWTVIVDGRRRIVFLVFEESSGKRDWQNNLNFPVKVYRNQESCLKASRGWGNAWKSCNDEVMAKFITTIAENPGFQPVICGWSYGGAMSVLAAEDFFYRTKMRASVITFGAPKPLWGKKSYEYVMSCVSCVSQYAHVNDCVPLMPPLPGYKMLNKVSVGKGFSIAKLFKPDIYHCIYGDKKLYL